MYTEESNIFCDQLKEYQINYFMIKMQAVKFYEQKLVFYKDGEVYVVCDFAKKKLLVLKLRFRAFSGTSW